MAITVVQFLRKGYKIGNGKLIILRYLSSSLNIRLVHVFWINDELSKSAKI